VTSCNSTASFFVLRYYLR